MISTLSKLRRLSDTRWTVPAVLLGLCGLSYGVLLPWLGFYWDDWPMVWFNHAYGPSVFPSVWAMIRPLLGWLYIPTMALFGDHPWRWQLFGILTRWLSALILWWTLGRVWPENRRQSAWVAAAFAVYPGFRQQSVAVIYSHYHLVLALHLFSLGAMLQAVRLQRGRLAWMSLAVASGAASLFSVEYFVGLEVLRPVLLWRALGGPGVTSRERLRRTVVRWAPFAAVVLGYLGIRLFHPGITLYEPVLLRDLGQQPGETIRRLTGTIAGDLAESGLLAWVQAFVPPDAAEFGRRSLSVYLALTAIALAASALWLLPTVAAERPADVQASSRWGREAAGLGLLGLLGGGWPFWVAGQPLLLRFPFDRFTLGMMVGACLALVGLMEWLIRIRFARALLLCLLITAAVGAHFVSATSFRRAWDAQQRFLWNLSWRVPALAPGTAILSNELSLAYSPDNALTAAINWMYAPEFEGAVMPYMLFNLEERLQGAIPGLDEGVPIAKDYRSTRFVGTTSQAIVIALSPQSCLRLVDPIGDAYSMTIPYSAEAAEHLSRLDLIQADGEGSARLPPHLWGQEATDSWCYYFEQADLARQLQDWARVVELGEAAFSIADQPNRSDERIPFVEGYAHMGEWERALELTHETMAHNDESRRSLCAAWLRVEASTTGDGERERVIAQAEALVCTGP